MGNRKIIQMVLAAVLLLGALSVGLINHIDRSAVRIACVGDSLTYGSGVRRTRKKDNYPAQLQKLLGKNYKVKEFGLRNATASRSGNLPYLESREFRDAMDYQADLVFIMLGTNDSKTYNWDREAYTDGLKEIVQGFMDTGSHPRVILMASPWCYSVKGGDIAEYDIQPAVVAEGLQDAVREVAVDTGADFIDLYSPTEGRRELYTDGIHFNAGGYAFIAAEINRVSNSLRF